MHKAWNVCSEVISHSRLNSHLLIKDRYDGFKERQPSLQHQVRYSYELQKPRGEIATCIT